MLQFDPCIPKAKLGATWKFEDLFLQFFSFLYFKYSFLLSFITSVILLSRIFSFFLKELEERDPFLSASTGSNQIAQLRNRNALNFSLLSAKRYKGPQ